MAETVRHRLQPSLLDRLTDDQPDQVEETFEQATLSDDQLRASVLRDLRSLFSAHSSTKRFAGHARVAKSVLNYGIPDLTGMAVGSLKRDSFRLEQALLQIIKAYEPRIGNLHVSMEVGSDQEIDTIESSIILTIQGDLWGYPASPICMRTEIDVATGDITIEEQTGS